VTGAISVNRGSGVLVLGYPLKIHNSKDYIAIKFNPKANGRRIRAFWDTRTEEKFKR
jgi:ribosomal protein S19